MDGVIPIEQQCGHQADGDAAEDAVVDLRLLTELIQHAVEHDRRHGLEDRFHHQVPGGRGQRGGTVGLLGETDGHADSEQQRQVGEDRAARRAHRLEERADHRRLDAAEQVGLAQPQQNAGGGQECDGQHEALAQPLQLREAGDTQPRLLLLGHLLF